MSVPSTLKGSVQSTGLVGLHNKLFGRDLPDQHPIEAITGLREILDNMTERPTVEKLGSYLYKVTYSVMPPETNTDISIGGCSAFVQDGKLYRNFDWGFSEDLSFMVNCQNFTGMAFGQLADIPALPYRVVDGVNKYGIMVATLILFNDWEWAGEGNVPLFKIPYLILSNIKSMDQVPTALPLNDLRNTPTLEAYDYLAQFIVSDGTTTYVITPSETEHKYVVQDITANPKLANFKWVPEKQVDRRDLQKRPTGVERWNMMPCELEELEFTKAYKYPNRLSEFIGIRETTKDSTDTELLEIYEDARQLYLHRERDGQTWQTMHSVVYSRDGIEALYTQEDWDTDYAANVSREYLDKQLNKIREDLKEKPTIHIDTTEYWENHPSFVGKEGDIIVYSDYSVMGDILIPNFKIADGLAYVGALPFVGDDVREVLANHISNQSIHVSQTDREYWNSKVNVKIDPTDYENIIFYR